MWVVVVRVRVREHQGQNDSGSIMVVDHTSSLGLRGGCGSLLWTDGVLWSGLGGRAGRGPS